MISATRPGVDAPAVAQDGDAVAEPEDLVEPVGDVDDGDAVAPEEVDDPEQALDLARLERRGRLVHDHHAVVGGDRPGDGDHLLDAEAELAQRPPDVDVDAVPRQDAAVASRCIRPKSIRPQPVRRLAAEEQVPRHAQQRDEVDLLVDRADAGRLGIARPGERDGRAAVAGSRRRRAGRRRS